MRPPQPRLPAAPADRQPARLAPGSTDVVRSLTLLPNNEFASCSNDGSVRVWSFDGELRAVLTGHKSFVYSVCVLPNGDLASAGEDHCVRIWSSALRFESLSLALTTGR